MVVSLKDQNALRLYALVAANLLAFFALQRSGAIGTGDWRAMFADWPSAAPEAVGLALIGLLNAQIDALTKARLVFFKRENPLPGAEAFTRWGPRDARVDMHAMAAKYGVLPIEAAAQNRLWYRIYKSVERDLGVEHAHREYLFARDFAFFACAMIAVLGVSAIITFSSVAVTLFYIAALIVQFVITARAARLHGRRLVCTVLAVAATNEEGPRAAAAA